jgi:hypothetical protein
MDGAEGAVHEAISVLWRSRAGCRDERLQLLAG